MPSTPFSWIDLFFPGVLVHEAAHAIACFACGIKVHRISVHRSSGMVVHDKTNARASLLIGIFPLLMGGAIAFILLHEAQRIGSAHFPWSIFLLWVGFSIAFHAIPSTQDIQNIVASTERRFGELWKGKRSFSVKITKTLAYGIAWIGSWILLLLAIAANASILVRIALGVGLLWGSG